MHNGGDTRDSQERRLQNHILCGANLCFAQLDEYLSLLLEVGLLEAVNKGEKTIYKTTAKGLHYIQDHKKLTLYLDMSS